MTIYEYTHHVELDSDAIEAVWYNSNTNELYIEFVNSEDIYRYDGVSINVYNALISASSVGSYYQKNIKRDNYSATKMFDPTFVLKNVYVKEFSEHDFEVTFVLGDARRTWNTHAVDVKETLDKFFLDAGLFGITPEVVKVEKIV